MLDTPSLDDVPAGRRSDRWGRRVDVAFAVWALVLLYAMFAMQGYETVPYHIIFVSFAAVYGFRIWSRGVTVAVLTSIVVGTGAVLVIHWRQDVLPTDELFEIVLMPMILGAMVWHAQRRAVAQQQLEVMAQQERERRVREHEFARDTSHALRTPLTIARGHVELIRDAADTELVREDADVVLAELDRIGRMASRLLAIAELERPDALNLQTVDIAALVRDVHSRWSASVERDWSVTVPPTLPAVVDEDVLRVVLDALIENAVSFTKEPDHVHLVCRSLPGRFLIGVSDSGSGIDIPDAKLVFQRFWRSATKRDGTGLGLSYVRAAAEAHGGTAFAGPSTYGGAMVACILPLSPTGEVDADLRHAGDMVVART